MDDHGLGDRLRTLRVAAGLTQTELAQRAQLSRAYLAALERGLSSATKRPPNPSRKVLNAIAQALNVDLATLRGKDAAPSQVPLPFVPEVQHSLPLLNPQGLETVGAWTWPAADGVIDVTTPDPALGLAAGDAVIIRRGSAGEGLCLLLDDTGPRWGQVAMIGDRPFLLAPDGSYRPLGGGVRLTAVALAIVRSI